MNIIGLGCVSCLGQGLSTFFDLQSLQPTKPERGFSNIQLNDTQFYQGVLNEGMARSGFELSLLACKEALNDAVMFKQEDKDKFFLSARKNIALVLATGAGDTKQTELFASDSPYGMAKKIADTLCLSGMFLTISNACSSSGYAVSICEDLLDEGHDAVLLCGVEAKSTASQAVFKSLLVLDPDSCRPFEADRNGTVLGCGAAALLFSKNERNEVKRYAKVSGMSMNCDAFHATAPDPSGVQIRRCIDESLISACLSYQDVDLLIPHATGTQLNDRIEMDLLSEIFPACFESDSILLLKKYIGHTGGASAAFSLLVAALYLYFSGVKQSNNKNYRSALISCTAFGGNNSSVILSKAC